MKLNLIANLNGALMGLSFGSNTTIIVGREIGCTIAPLTADGLSRHHAKLFVKNGKWMVADLCSTNGTFRNGKKLEGATQLAPGDKLQFGHFLMTVDEIVEEPASATTASANTAAPTTTVAPQTPEQPASVATATTPNAEPKKEAISPITPATKPRRPVLPVAGAARPAFKFGLKFGKKPDASNQANVEMTPV